MSDHENHHHHEEHHHHHEGDHHDEHQQPNQSDSSSHNDNGYVVVPPTPQSSVDNGNGTANAVDRVLDFLTNDKQEEIQQMLADIRTNTEESINTITRGFEETIKAEADSSSSVSVEKPKNPEPPKSTNKDSSNSSCGSNILCPYYMMALDRLTKVEIPPRVKDLLLWKNPKLTGAVFGSAFVLLISIAMFSLLIVVSALFLTAMTLIGSYRFYLALIYRIKGTYDNTFDKLSAQDVSLPKDKVQNLARLLETDFNLILNKLKSILLWDNLTTSGLAFAGFYVVYSIGCWFNTITLLILALVSVFTLPKVYDVYKKPIDQGIEKATSLAHQTVKQIMKKVPILSKKKAQ